MKILVIVDMQKDFVSGALGSDAAKAIVPKVVAESEKDEYYNVIYTKDTHYEDYLDTLEGQLLPVPHCIVDTEGCEIIDELTKDGLIVEKETFGSFNLEDYIRIEIWRNTELMFNEEIEIVLCGLLTDICVVSNTLILKAACPAYKISVLADCCAGSTPEKHEAALSVMESCQVNVIR